MANETRDIDALIRQVDALNIEFSENESGGFTVCSSAEPFFCYDAASLEDAQKLVADTLQSYARRFFHLDDLTVSIEETLLETLPVTIERGIPRARLTPAFDLAA